MITVKIFLYFVLAFPHRTCSTWRNRA